MKSRFSFILILIIAPGVYAQQKQVCFTIDDMPLVTYGITDTVYQRTIMDKLIEALTSNHIPAMGFVNEFKLYNNNELEPFQVSLLRQWLSAGLSLGNHTYSHQDYNHLSSIEFFKEIDKGEQVMRKLLPSYNQELKYFRHPFLHAGGTEAKSDSLNAYLKEHQYIVAPVTLDNADYLFAVAYKRAQDKHDINLMQKIGGDYINYMEQKVLFYERMSDGLFQKQISQILLLHASALNSDYISELAKMFKKHNYNFVSLREALQDKAYETPVTVFGRWGISWLDRWALSRGKKGDFFKGDPEPPAYISN
jgi:peptidoglycan/xylan/chitin deacetylase (PgdA/CDA1 family)